MLKSQHTFLFADLAGFTAMTEAHGDERAAELVGEFTAMVDALLAQHGGEAVKGIGDALMLRFSSAGDAVRLGLAIVEEAAARHGHLMVRVGMNTGPAVQQGSDWFGAAVNLAARVSGAARAGEVLLTAATRASLCEADDVVLRAQGVQAFRNVGDPVRLYSAHRRGGLVRGDVVIDPVCRMRIDPEESAGSLSHDGFEYRFCSLECAGRFAADPGRYAVPGDELAG